MWSFHGWCLCPHFLPHFQQQPHWIFSVPPTLCHPSCSKGFPGAVFYGEKAPQSPPLHQTMATAPSDPPRPAEFFLRLSPSSIMFLSSMALTIMGFVFALFTFIWVINVQLSLPCECRQLPCLLCPWKANAKQILTEWMNEWNYFWINK